MQQVDTLTAEIRRKLTEKYMVEFWSGRRCAQRAIRNDEWWNPEWRRPNDERQKDRVACSWTGVDDRAYVIFFPGFL